MTSFSDLKYLLGSRILLLDGAMGTMIQSHSLSEADYRGDRFIGHSSKLEGCNDVLCLSQPSIIESIHISYLNAGADIISTNTFNANAISLADYGLQSDSGLIKAINHAGASIARKAAEESAPREWGGKALVAGSVGPTNKSATMSPDVADPAQRNVDYTQLRAAYLTQCEGLIEGGVDIILFETVFDTLNLKAGIDAAREAMEICGRNVPIMVSATISDKSGRTLSGQTIAAFATSVENYPEIISLGLNCSFGPKDIIPSVEELSQVTGHFISTHPNAGLPDALGQYKLSPESFVEETRPLLSRSLVNIIGGCCGTTPKHIAALRTLVDNFSPHFAHPLDKALRISGLERVEVRAENNFLVVGERCNVAGSRKFLRLIKEKSYDEALSIAARQVEDGARVIDINMDDPLLDAAEEMKHFLRLYASDPDVAKVPVMVDSSNWNVVVTALENLQGKSIVNSISLKEGEDVFLRRAKRIRELGAAVIVMAFDENGQADTYSRKIEICSRAYDLLTKKCGFHGEDIIFDVNVMAVATGLEEHFRYGIDFIEAVRWIKENLPGARTSGGISNLSFAFRGKNDLRDAMHAVFLYHAISAGLDMAIMNPASSLTYGEIPLNLRNLIEDVVLARRKEASDELAVYASEASAGKKISTSPEGRRNLTLPVEIRIKEMVVAGKTDFLIEDIDLLSASLRAVDIVEGPLMEGMKLVGDLFGEGKMFLPQVVKTARVMKMAVDHLTPLLVAQSSGEKEGKKVGKVLLATVKGDVHDIGKNIVSIVMGCNNFEVIDLGVMVGAEKIVEAAIAEKPDIICLSGLITPSLAEMTHTVASLKDAGISIPVLVGGATTSALHTALKIAPFYDGVVVHMKDASQNPIIASKLLDPTSAEISIADIRSQQQRLRDEYNSAESSMIPLEEARIKGRSKRLSESSPIPKIEVGKTILRNFTITELSPFINWKMLLHAWGLHSSDCGCGCQSSGEAEKILADSRRILKELEESGHFDGYGILRILKAHSEGDNIVIGEVSIPTLRQQTSGSGLLSISDFINPQGDFIGVFMAGAGFYIDDLRAKYETSGDSYAALLLQSLADRLAEASSEYLHYLTRKEYWGYAPEEELNVKTLLQGRYCGIRPAMGYPMLPDQLLNQNIYDLLLPYSGYRSIITDNGALSPSATVSGLYIAHPEAKYFLIGKIDADQLSDYAARRKMNISKIKEILNQ